MQIRGPPASSQLSILFSMSHFGKLIKQRLAPRDQSLTFEFSQWLGNQTSPVQCAFSLTSNVKPQAYMHTQFCPKTPPCTFDCTTTTRKSSCVDARGIPTAAYQVLHLLYYPGGGGVPLSWGTHLTPVLTWLRGIPSLDGGGTPSWGTFSSYFDLDGGYPTWGTPSPCPGLGPVTGVPPEEHVTSGNIMGWRWKWSTPPPTPGVNWLKT